MAMVITLQCRGQLTVENDNIVEPLNYMLCELLNGRLEMDKLVMFGSHHRFISRIVRQNGVNSLLHVNKGFFHNIMRFKHNTYVKVTEDAGVRNIVLNHPRTRNSLSMEMMIALEEAITSNVSDNSLRAIVLSAEGPVFSAGHNLKELTSEAGVPKHQEIFTKSSNLMLSIIKCPVPVIAKVNGLAAAAGCQLVSTCDIIVASETSKFSTPGANFGIFCSTPGIAIGRSMPKSAALYMLLVGEPITAQEAYTYGLITKTVPEVLLDEEINDIVKHIKSKSKTVLTLGKEFFYKQMKVGIEDAYNLGEEIMVRNISMEDGREGVDSFVEKRKPQWKHI